MRSVWWQNVGLVLLVAAAVGLTFLAVTRDPAPQSASDNGRQATGSAQSGSGSAGAEAGGPPAVEDQVRTDFALTDQLPPGSRTHDNQATGSPLSVRDGLLTHDAPKAALAVGSLEVPLSSDVQRIGARVVFPEERSGSVNLVAWSSSLVDAREAGEPVPTSGLRLVAAPGFWQLTLYDKEPLVIAGAQFTAPEGPVTFDLYRAGARVWVVDPSGAVTRVNDPRIDRLAGPWACWQLSEDEPTAEPAAIQEIWAG